MTKKITSAKLKFRHLNTCAVSFNGGEETTGLDDMLLTLTFSEEEKILTLIKIVYELFQRGFSLVDDRPDGTRVYGIRSCISCNIQKAEFACLQCLNASYCSEACQEEHWSKHSNECKLTQ